MRGFLEFSLIHSNLPLKLLLDDAMKRIARTFILALASFVIAFLFVQKASAGDISGTYISQTPTNAFCMQLIQKPNGDITGLYREADIGKDLNVTQNVFPISGSIDGSNLVITISSNGLSSFISGNIILAGSISEDTLTLSGGSGSSMINLTLSKGDLTKYQTMVANPSQEADAAKKSESIQTIEALLQKKIEEILPIITQSSVTIPARVAELENESMSFRSDTVTLENLLANEQSAGGVHTQAGYNLSSQIFTLHSKDVGAGNTLLSRFQSIKINGFLALLPHAETLNNFCTRLGATESNESMFSGPGQLFTDCVSLSEQLPNLVQQTDNLTKAYENAISVWHIEAPKQSAIDEQSR